MKGIFSSVSTVVVFASTVFMMLVAPVPALAQQSNPCTNDFKQFCSDVSPGGGRLLRCYEEKKDKMSAACVGWAELIKSNAEVARAVCAKDIESSCSISKGDPLAMVNCLQSNYIDLSMDCRNKLNEFKAMYPVQPR